ncbi:endonuclease/exonuclease/phosphatase family protein [Algirhabdus cladophorae]|uniref:endonuclease/exonuclease/phosphatase family protein n=1 Tax=Algirhabdus cladophorae TaxID=3377108 RepID=UPI003B848461
MRVATYNVEWFDRLFDDEGALCPDTRWSGRRDVKRFEQIKALGQVFAVLDADAIMVIEAPDTSRRRSGTQALERFAQYAELRANTALIGFGNDTQQEIALLYDPDALTVSHDPKGTLSGPPQDAFGIRFDGQYEIDLDIDAKADQIKFSKPPLEVKATTAKGFEFQMLGVHAKSKAPHGAKTEREAMKLSIANRRKQLAQCIWIRERVQAHMDAATPLMVLGDFNDGPGLDEFEQLFGRSGVEIVLGEGPDALFDPHVQMALTQRFGARPTTSRFFLRDERRYLQALLDYIMVTPELAAKKGRWHIWHPFEDPDCFSDESLQKALLTASDHFPVTLDIDI